MIRIALVGDIGSGKSHVARLFGYPVFNADAEVNKLYKKSRTCYKKLKKELPNYINSFPIKKNKLSSAVMFNKNNLKKINKVVHPEIRRKMNKFIKRNKNNKIIFLDIPLLIENKINRKNDIIIFVDAKKKEINKRLKKRGNFNHKSVNRLRKFQLAIEHKKRKSDFIIKNNFKNNSVKKDVKVLIKKILFDARSNS